MFFKKVINLDRPVIIKGKDLKEKLKNRINQLDQKIEELNVALKEQYATVMEGTAKAAQKREMLKAVSEYELQKVWVTKMLTIIEDKMEYALNLTEATTLGVIEEK